MSRYPSCRHWATLIESLGHPPNADSIFARLIELYSEPHRAYHNLNHIVSMLDERARINDQQIDVALAIWFHDAIYDPRAKDNEERSAMLAEEAIAKMGLAPELGKQVRGLIMATKHTGPPSDEPAKLIVDLDLMILGAPEDEFDRYEMAIRKEYDGAPEEDFREARARILKSFLDRPTIFFTQRFQNAYEAAARRNLARSIERLQPVR